MTKRSLTETQYMELRHYGEHTARWVNGGPLKSLIANGLIRPCAHDRNMFEITPAGVAALEGFKARLGGGA